MKTLFVKAHNGGWCVWWQCDGYTVFESYHATLDSANKRVGQLAKDYGYVFEK